MHFLSFNHRIPQNDRRSLWNGLQPGIPLYSWNVYCTCAESGTDLIPRATCDYNQNVCSFFYLLKGPIPSIKNLDKVRNQSVITIRNQFCL